MKKLGIKGSILGGIQQQNTYLAAQENKDATTKAAMDDAFRYQDPRGPYREFKGGTR